MIEIKELHPKILVFKNALSCHNEIIEYYEKNKTWDKWYTFGSMTQLTSHSFEFDNFPTQNEWNKTVVYEDSQEYCKKIADTFYYCTNVYFQKNNLQQKKLLFNNFNIAKYYDNAGVDENLAMNYHTDFQQEKSNILDYNFYVTCLFYLNDNYEDGEICFKILDEKQEKIEFSTEYKPTAGDVVVFPSMPPFYHGVKKTKNGEKYIIRTYWKKLIEPNINFNLEDYKNNFFIINENDKSYYFQGYKNT